MATIKSKVLQILGENNSTYLDNVVNPEYIVEEAIWDTATSMPRRLLLAETPEPVDPTSIPLDPGVPTYQDVQSSPVDIADKIVLLVLRTQTDYTVAAGPTVTAYNYITRACKEIPYEDSFQALDGGSIYFATSNSPVYWIENSGAVPTLNTAPAAAGSSNTQYLADPDTDNNGSGLQVFTYPRQQVYNAGDSPTIWAHTTAYAVGDKVAHETKNYVCIGDHTSTNDNVVTTGKPDTVGSTVWRVSWEFLETIDNSSE